MIWLPPTRRTTRPAQFVRADHALSLTQGLIGAYIPNGSNGLAVNDASASPVNGTGINLTWVTGREGRVGSFNGTTTEIAFTGGGIPGFNKTTPISGAFRWNCTSASFLTLACQCNVSITGGWVCRINGGTAGTFDFFVANSSGSNGWQRYTSATFNDGKWHTGIFTYDGSNTLAGIHLYVDSPSEQAATTGVNSDPGTIAGGSLAIGRLLNNTGQYYAGSLDFAYLWNRVLLPGEIAAILQNPWTVLAPLPTGIRAAFVNLPSTAGKAWVKSGTFAAKSAKVRVSGSFVTMPMKVRVGGSFITSK